MTDTIFAVASGRPPAAIAVLRVSGPGAAAAGVALGRRLPPPRRASLRVLRGVDGGVLDHALMLWFPGPATATGEDLLELHLHGGAAVIAAVEQALAARPDARRAEPGEFTRRALRNGRIDLAQAEGLADLLSAETERERRAALTSVEGQVTRAVRQWMDRLTDVSAEIEAAIDFEDEEDVPPVSPADIDRRLRVLAGEVEAVLARPTVERLRAGIRVVLTGPPNAGKSSLFNALLDRDAAIVTAVPGTTRDCIEAHVQHLGMAYTLVDTAGIRDDSADPVERIGVGRALQARQTADIVLWLDDAAPDVPALRVWPRCEGERALARPADAIATSVNDLTTIDALWRAIAERAAAIMDYDGDVLLSERQSAHAATIAAALREAQGLDDMVVKAELVRQATTAAASLLGLDATQAMLDALFSRFCVGK